MHKRLKRTVRFLGFLGRLLIHPYYTIKEVLNDIGDPDAGDFYSVINWVALLSVIAIACCFGVAVHEYPEFRYYLAAGALFFYVFVGSLHRETLKECFGKGLF